MNATTLASTFLAKLEDQDAPMDKLIRSLAAYLIEEKQVGKVDTVIREIQRLQLQDKGILYVQATSAFPLKQDQLNEIEDRFKNKNNASKVVIEQIIDTDVIGGVRCETAEQRLDLTVRRQLQRLSAANSVPAHDTGE